jgi:hypothetical protein
MKRSAQGPGPLARSFPEASFPRLGEPGIAAFRCFFAELFQVPVEPSSSDGQRYPTEEQTPAAEEIGIDESFSVLSSPGDLQDFIRSAILLDKLDKVAFVAAENSTSTDVTTLAFAPDELGKVAFSKRFFRTSASSTCEASLQDPSSELLPPSSVPSNVEAQAAKTSRTVEAAAESQISRPLLDHHLGGHSEEPSTASIAREVGPQDPWAFC